MTPPENPTSPIKNTKIKESNKQIWKADYNLSLATKSVDSCENQNEIKFEIFLITQLGSNSAALPPIKRINKKNLAKKSGFGHLGPFSLC